MNGNGKIQKTYFTRMHQLLVYSMDKNKSIHYVVLAYETPMTSYRKARRDFENFWLRFSEAFPGCDYFCSIDKSARDSWYINFFLISSDSSEGKITIDELSSYWKHGFCLWTTKSESHQLPQIFPLIQVCFGIPNQYLDMVYIKGRDLHYDKVKAYHRCLWSAKTR